MSDTNPLRRIPTHAVPASLDVDIGTFLKEARVKKGETVEAISQQTRVPKKLIEALETNRFEEFPAMVYLRGFLKIYCEHLDVEFAAVWKRLIPDNTPQQAAAGGGAASSEEAPKEEAPETGTRGLGQLLPLGLIAVILVAGILAVWVGRKPEPGKPAPAQAPVPPPVLQPISKPADPVVVFTFKRDTWIRLSVDGRVKFEGIVPQGARQEYKPSSLVTLRTPNPEDILLTLNGSSAELPALDPSGAYVIQVR